MLFRRQLHYWLSKRSRILDLIGWAGMRLYLYRENVSFVPEINGEEYLLSAIKKSNENCRVIFDVGANVGSWTEMALKRWPEADYFLVDASRSSAEILTKKFANMPNIHVFHIAFGLREDTVEVEEGKSKSSHNRIKPQGGTLGSVRITSGFNFCKEIGIATIDLMKIDTEGFDLEVIFGFKELIESHEIGIIQFEHYATSLFYNRPFTDVISLFRTANYNLSKLFPEGVRFIEDEQDRFPEIVGVNFVAFGPQKHGLAVSLRTR